MSGEIALDTSVAIRYLNGDSSLIEKLSNLSEVFLPTVVVGELLYGALNSFRSAQNYPKFLDFINSCTVKPLIQNDALVYAEIKLYLKNKGRPIPTNDIWIAAQCFSQNWVLISDDSDFTYIDNLCLERW
ncbi:type II toxin-antitoxin system VapC family toxin [Thermosynechococcaceae cyanobacterium BACA0444]|uniref:Type II toxin-antitoxin system VapC family toxin n=1 Tax=Pseudocalidococcus azoricus BACA0444 TaxID=2918990 RepID=A0AAE4FR01_9CYAN|nr:type II toxin-antitoxin system VapC family toxin [Pseudocalidococcus azoricus]MDS3859957.1 type II toxin-antitoxin system VapC family toxin [Pseudocalidococcus azoricus BACA0444]